MSKLQPLFLFPALAIMLHSGMGCALGGREEKKWRNAFLKMRVNVRWVFLPLSTLEKWCFRASAMGGEKKKRKKSCNVFGEGRRRSFFLQFLVFFPERESVSCCLTIPERSSGHRNNIGSINLVPSSSPAIMQHTYYCIRPKRTHFWAVGLPQRVSRGKVGRVLFSFPAFSSLFFSRPLRSPSPFFFFFFFFLALFLPPHLSVSVNDEERLEAQKQSFLF